ncbi:unnamed protein product [Durusdinium trenchii]|uniref:ABC transporter domain-containing protein n=1 Tax=Durusdinium trenchii TaxID=1381693 RepID=A0ABP0Q7E5_9DINO
MNCPEEPCSDGGSPSPSPGQAFRRLNGRLNKWRREPVPFALPPPPRAGTRARASAAPCGVCYTALARSLLVACVRCVAQLYLAGGILLTYLLSTRHPGVVWSWIFFTGLFAATEATARVEYVYPKLFRHMATSILMALSLVLSSSLFLGVLTPEPYWSPRTWIPVSGMILGNSVTACALAAAKVTDALATERQTLELRLVRGANWKEALRSVLRTTLSTSLTPIINALSVTGIVHIPGMMTGQLLSGQSPFTAAAYQVLIFFLIAASTTTTVQVVSQLAVRTLVDQKQHRLQLDDLRARPREEQPPCRGLRKVMREMLRGVSAKPAQVRAMRPVKILDDHDDHGDSEGSTETKTGGEALVKQLQVTLDGHVSPLTLHRGDRVALLGPSGIGKSRMLRRIAGLEPGGVEVEDAVEWRRQVSLVPQGQANLEGTPRDFLKEVLSYGSQSLTRDEEPEKLLEELAREWDVDPSLLSQPWNTLSGGQAQRISLAIAVCLKPEVLLLDESTSALDEATTLKVEKSLRARGTPILMVSHSSSQVDRFCNRRIQLAWND